MSEFCTMALCGLTIGLLFGVPVGSVGALVLQRTLSHGFLTGLLTGVGSSVADCAYAAVGAFGLTFISEPLLHWRTPISVVGGLLMIAMGIASLRKQHDDAAVAPHVTASHVATPYANNLGVFLSALAVGITNPAAILGFLFAFSLFGIAGPLGPLRGVALVAGILAGTMCWWLALAGSVAKLRGRCAPGTVRRLERCFAVLVAAIGIGVFIVAAIGLFTH
ncbi:LysE family translocator [Bifidobacterium oedipodis]|uniref:Lysine transporter LysE n=1 Tax=Bifidobacterium oedipodis TaxID=2675322 RepID=A0A7Y0HU63_9BIFI|nr:LysE family transporter [Bifidobacterium sp. DSM 109957]NMM94414.1 lysine transporter LysE [Bifidobacterium sp. DSM 109957]